MAIRETSPPATGGRHATMQPEGVVVAVTLLAPNPGALADAGRLAVLLQRSEP